MKVVSVVGARPQFIKCAPVSCELRKFAQDVLVHTGQHYDDSMSGVFLELAFRNPIIISRSDPVLMGIRLVGMLKKIEEVLLKEKPDVVLVYGDTNSTLAGALAAAKLHIPVAHVEAGLRSHNRKMPEEINRVMTDHLSSLLLCPTDTAVGNLRKEGVTNGVHLVGDVMYDALLDGVEIAKRTSKIINRLAVQPGQYILVTVHRAENTDDPQRLEGIITALIGLADAGHRVVFPVHPRTQKHLRLSLDLHERVLQIDPVSYLDMLFLESVARVILTDSGGIQKEAYWLRVPCLTLREETEWKETVESGWNHLVGTDNHRILHAVREIGLGSASGWSWKKGEASMNVARLIVERNF